MTGVILEYLDIEKVNKINDLKLLLENNCY